MRLRIPPLRLAAAIFALLAAMTAAAQTPADRALIDAAGAGDLARVEALLKHGAGVHAVDGRKRTALIAAAYGGHVGIAQRLIAAGAPVDAEDDVPNGALMISCVRGNVALARVLVAAGANVNASNQHGGNCIIPAAERGHVEIVREMLKTKINVNHVNRLGWTALLEAVILGSGGAAHQEIVKLLLAGGADPNIADRDGVTPLAHARKRNFAAIAALIEKSGGR